MGFETPDDAAGGSAAKSDKTFSLYESRDVAVHAPDNRAVRYQVVFHAQEAGGLEPGASSYLGGQAGGQCDPEHAAVRCGGRSVEHGRHACD